jgi:hypothetical protein
MFHLVYADLYDKMANSYSIREPRNGPPPPKKTLLPFVTSYHSEFIHRVQALWRFKSPMLIKLIHELPCRYGTSYKTFLGSSPDICRIRVNGRKSKYREHTIKKN